MKKWIALVCAVLLLGTSARAVEVSAPSALLMEKETGTVLFAKNEHEKLEPPRRPTPAPWAAARSG